MAGPCIDRAPSISICLQTPSAVIAALFSGTTDSQHLCTIQQWVLHKLSNEQNCGSGAQRQSPLRGSQSREKFNIYTGLTRSKISQSEL